MVRDSTFRDLKLLMENLSIIMTIFFACLIRIIGVCMWVFHFAGDSGNSVWDVNGTNTFFVLATGEFTLERFPMELQSRQAIFFTRPVIKHKSFYTLLQQTFIYCTL